jgi:hypothetical protein
VDKLNELVAEWTATPVGSVLVFVLVYLVRILASRLVVKAKHKPHKRRKETQPHDCRH